MAIFPYLDVQGNANKKKLSRKKPGFHKSQLAEQERRREYLIRKFGCVPSEQPLPPELEKSPVDSSGKQTKERPSRLQQRVNRARTKPGYKKYLASNHWQNKRRQALNHYGHRCICGATEGLQVHHLSYKNLHQEPMEDLEVLCHDCHKAQHPEKPIEGWSTFPSRKSKAPPKLEKLSKNQKRRQASRRRRRHRQKELARQPIDSVTEEFIELVRSF